MPLFEPCTFGDPKRPLFGMLHRPASPTDAAVVIVNPFGYEAICAHRSLRHLAASIAEAGALALRFDCDGTGDSAGDDLDPGRVEAWVASVKTALSFVRDELGATRLFVVGLRLGATLGAIAASERDDVDGLVMLAPVTSGRAYVRELKLLQAALGLEAPPAGVVVDEQVDEALGFALSAETKAALSKIDLGRLAPSPAKRVLILDRDDMPPSDALGERLRQLGVDVEQRPSPGYVDMMLDAHRAQVPERMIQDVVRWLGDVKGARRASDSSSVGTGRALWQSAEVAPGIVETPVRFGAAERLVGVVTSPADAVPSEGHASLSADRLGIVLLNAGAVHRIGPNRMYVALARRWAAQGHLVLRLDVSGIGDSAQAPGEDENDVYTSSAAADLRAAVALLRSHGAASVHVGGICSGAYNAFRSSVAGAEIDGIFAVNPATFTWKKGMSLDVSRTPYTENVVQGEASRYGESAFRLEKWKKLLRGDVKLAPVVQIVARHAAARLRDRSLGVARRLGLRLPGDVGASLESLAERGVALHFLFASGEPGLALLESRAGASVEKLTRAGRLELTIVEGPDHTFTARWAQDALGARLDAHFARARARAGGTGAPARRG